MTRRIPTWLAVAAASLPMFMATLDNLVMTSALPSIRLDLGASVEELQWFVNAYTLAFATTILTAVALGDRRGRRTLFVAGIAVFTAGSVLSALSTEPWMLIGSRALQGFGAAAVLPLSLTLLVASVGLRTRPLAIGIWGGISGLGVALGPIVGGAVVQGFSWQAIFWINVPVGVLSIPLALLALPNTFGARVRADLVGLALSGLGILGLVYGIVRGNDAGWTSAEVAGTLAVGVALLVAFVLWERRSPAPLLPMRLFRDRSFSVANVVGLAFSFGVFGAIFILIQFLQIVQGRTPLEAGVMTMPWTLAPLVVAPLAGFFAPRVGTRMLMVVGLALQAAGLSWIAATMAPDVQYAVLLPAFVLSGVGMGLVFAPLSTAILATMADRDHAKASGTSSAIREIGVALGIAVLTAVFVGGGGELTPTGYVDAAIPAVAVGAGVLALAAVLAVALPTGKVVRASTDAPEVLAAARAGGAPALVP
jgi:EmrB/QacA subfamily drug resistance transporter